MTNLKESRSISTQFKELGSILDIKPGLGQYHTFRFYSGQSKNAKNETYLIRDNKKDSRI